MRRERHVAILTGAVAARMATGLVACITARLSLGSLRLTSLHLYLFGCTLRRSMMNEFASHQPVNPPKVRVVSCRCPWEKQ